MKQFLSLTLILTLLMFSSCNLLGGDNRTFRTVFFQTRPVDVNTDDFALSGYYLGCDSIGKFTAVDGEFDLEMYTPDDKLELKLEFWSEQPVNAYIYVGDKIVDSVYNRSGDIQLSYTE